MMVMVIEISLYALTGNTDIPVEHTARALHIGWELISSTELMYCCYLVEISLNQICKIQKIYQCKNTPICHSVYLFQRLSDFIGL